MVSRRNAGLSVRPISSASSCNPMRLLTELKRRKVVRMAGLYLFGVLLLVQAAGTLSRE